MRCGRCWYFSSPHPDFSSLSPGSIAIAAPPISKPVLVLREGLNGAINEWSGPAKFVLYDDGVVITEKSDETSENSGETIYSLARLTPTQTSALLQSIDVKRIIGASNRRYGSGDGTMHEGVAWKLIYWTASSRTEVTILDSLDLAPAAIAKLVSKLEGYRTPGTRYLDFDYFLQFSGLTDEAGIQWPKEWTFVKFDAGMLKGERMPDTVYEYRLAAKYAVRLTERMGSAKTHCISVNGHTWRVRLYQVPRLPNDMLWVEHW